MRITTTTTSLPVLPLRGRAVNLLKLFQKYHTLTSLEIRYHLPDIMDVPSAVIKLEQMGWKFNKTRVTNPKNHCSIGCYSITNPHSKTRPRPQKRISKAGKA